MNKRHFFRLTKRIAVLGQVSLLSLVTMLITPTAQAAMVEVGTFGDFGWRSDDTRNASGVNLVGITNTNDPAPGSTPTAADDAAIASQLQFTTAPSGATFYGAVKIDGTTSNSGKSNLSTISPITGFAPSSDLLLPSFFAVYNWYKQPNPTSRTLAFKLGIQSANWGTGGGQSQNGFTATRSGESVWDLVLVNVSPSVDNAWNTSAVNAVTGDWNLFRQAGNGYYPVPGATAKTLAAWNADATFGPALFGPSAKVTSVQFGLGSSQRDAFAYLDYLQTNLLNGGDVINFVPEPSSLVLAGFGVALSLTAIRRRRNRGMKS